MYGGGVREVSGKLGLTSLTSTPGLCDVAKETAHAQGSWHPSGIGWPPYGNAAMWTGGLTN